jgi:hypothetical protein
VFSGFWFLAAENSSKGSLGWQTALQTSVTELSHFRRKLTLFPLAMTVQFPRGYTRLSSARAS